MHRLLILSSVLSNSGVTFSFSIFLIGKFVFQLNLAILKTLIFLKLAVAVRMTIYLTRTENITSENDLYLLRFSLLLVRLLK